MYLVSSSSHSPLAVFKHLNDAVGYLCSINETSQLSSKMEYLNQSTTVSKVYTDLDTKNSQKILGYIVSHVLIEPEFN
jgi:hypothetical protein